MVFKGTATRTAEDIARQVDSIGGNMDAFTAKEFVCFNMKVLDEHVSIAMDVLSDLVLNPVFDKQDIVRERGVILEEIKMDEDSPDYLVHEIFHPELLEGPPAGQAHPGHQRHRAALRAAAGGRLLPRSFHPGNLIITAAGNLQHAAFVETGATALPAPGRAPERLPRSPPTTQSRIIMRNKKSLEQVQICVGVPSDPVAHERRYACYILNTLLGGGMSSRLFQNIRERQGLAYAIYSELNPYRDTGCLSIYAGTSRESASKVVDCDRERVSRAEDQRPSATTSCAAPRTSSRAA